MANRSVPFFAVLTLAALCMVVGEAAAQNVVELRAADTRYRYLDWNHTFSDSAIVDLFYVGVPGSNEFDLGGGYGFKVGKLTISPLLYAVLGKEGSQRGAKIALLVLLDKDGWKINGFVGHYARISGSVGKYQVLDTLDVSRAFARRWEAGISSGFFHADGKWNPQVGPLGRLNDRWGAWAVSYRFGPQREFRVGRLFAF